MVTALSRIAARLREEARRHPGRPAACPRAGRRHTASRPRRSAEPPHRLRGFRAYPVGSRVTDARVAAPPTSSSRRRSRLRRPRPPRAGFGEAGPGRARAGRRRAGGRPPRPSAQGLGEPQPNSRCAPATGSPPAGSPGSSPPPPSAARSQRPGAPRTETAGQRSPAHRAAHQRDGGCGNAGTPAAWNTPALGSGSHRHRPRPGVAVRPGAAVQRQPPQHRQAGRDGGYHGARASTIRDVTGSDYARRWPAGGTARHDRTRAFPSSWPHDDPDAVTGACRTGSWRGTCLPDLDRWPWHRGGGRGLWTKTAADLVGYEPGWSSLLPDELAGEALRPTAGREKADGRPGGPGWPLNQPGRASPSRSATAPGGSSFLIVERASGGRA